MKERTGKDQEPRVVRNRDIPLLSRVLHIMQDILSLEKRYIWQRGRMFSATQHITGMPSGGGNTAGFDGVMAALSEIGEEHLGKIAVYMRELKAAEKIMNGIQSRTMRTFVALLYLEGLPPTKVKEELNLSEWGFRRARDSIERARDMESVVWRESYILTERREGE